MKKFDLPQLKVKMFDHEKVLTDSKLVPVIPAAMDEAQTAMSGQGIDNVIRVNY